jgi:hypothetical protein
MTSVADYARFDGALPPPSVPYLTEADSLWDAVVVDIRVGTLLGKVELLVAGLGAEPDINTAVIVLNDVSEFHFVVPAPGRTWLAIHSWEPHFDGTKWSVDISNEKGPRLRAVAAGAEIVVGHTAIADAPPPDFTSATDAEIAIGMVAWTTEFRPLARQVVGARNR